MLGTPAWLQCYVQNSGRPLTPPSPPHPWPEPVNRSKLKLTVNPEFYLTLVTLILGFSRRALQRLREHIRIDILIALISMTRDRGRRLYCQPT